MTSKHPSHTKIPKNAIPHNRIDSEMPSAVREFAELLAEIAAQQLRSIQNMPEGDHLHV